MSPVPEQERGLSVKSLIALARPFALSVQILRASLYSTSVPSIPTRSADDTSGRCTGMFAIPQDLLAIDKDMLNAGGILVGVFEGRVISYFLRIEYDNVGEISFADFTAILYADIVGGQGSHASDCFGKTD